MAEENYVDLTLGLGLSMSGPDADMELQRRLAGQIAGLASEHSTFKTWCDRADKLYYTTDFTAGGADLWADDPNLNIPGRSHVSVNTPQVYVNIPAALKAVKPVENMLATKNDETSRTVANHWEEIYTAWKNDQRYELKFAKAARVSELYGKTAGYVYYDRDTKKTCFSVMQNPRNLYLGYKTDDYEALEWAAHVVKVDPNYVREKYSVDVTVRRTADGMTTPWIGEMADEPRPEMSYGPARIEVWDYWYRKPVSVKGNPGEPTRMVTYNVVIAGNAVVRGPFPYPEYDGQIPYTPLFNDFIPGTPTGRAALHDMEQLIREKMARITAGAQMIAKGTAGDYWQLVGPDSPSRVTVKPKLNEVVGPGAGNRIEPITPFIMQFQLEQFLGRLDREGEVISGLNELLLGLAPVQALSSSKAINALTAQYEVRIAMSRAMFYDWRRDNWELASKVMAAKDENVDKVLKAGGGVLEIIAPSLSPRDDSETAVRAANLVGAKLISQARGMDMVGVDDPENEQDIIREERTDATLFPESVQVMASLLGALQSLGLQAPAAQGIAQDQLASGQNDLRTALGAGTPQGDEGSQGAGSQGLLPTAGLVPGATPANNAPFAQGPAPAAQTTQLQSLIQGGQAKSRIITSQKLGRR